MEYIPLWVACSLFFFVRGYLLWNLFGCLRFGSQDWRRKKKKKAQLNDRERRGQEEGREGASRKYSGTTTSQQTSSPSCSSILIRWLLEREYHCGHHHHHHHWASSLSIHSNSSHAFFVASSLFSLEDVLSTTSTIPLIPLLQDKKKQIITAHEMQITSRPTLENKRLQPLDQSIFAVQVP